MIFLSVILGAICICNRPSSDCVEILVNVLWDWVDLGVKFILNLEQVMLIILCDEVDCETQVTETTRATYSVKVGLRVTREVKVYHDVDRHDVNATSKKVSAYQASSLPVLEIMINSVAVTLLHS